MPRPKGSKNKTNSKTAVLSAASVDTLVEEYKDMLFIQENLNERYRNLQYQLSGLSDSEFREYFTKVA